MKRTPPLSNDEIVTILSDLAVRLGRLEVCIVNLYEAFKNHSEFQDVEILKTRMNKLQQEKRVPVQLAYLRKFQLNESKELKEQFTGLVQWINERLNQSTKDKSAF